MKNPTLKNGSEFKVFLFPLRGGRDCLNDNLKKKPRSKSKYIHLMIHEANKAEGAK